MSSRYLSPCRLRRIGLENVLHPVLISKKWDSTAICQKSFKSHFLHHPLCSHSNRFSAGSLTQTLWTVFIFLVARFQSGSERAFSLIDIHLSERCMRFQNGEARDAITVRQPPNACKRIITPIVIFQTYDYDCLFTAHMAMAEGELCLI